MSRAQEGNIVCWLAVQTAVAAVERGLSAGTISGLRVVLHASAYLSADIPVLPSPTAMTRYTD